MRNWEEYTIEENVLYINEKLSNGLTMREIEEKIYNVSERVITKRLTRKGYKRAKEGNRLFILDNSLKANTKPNKANCDSVKVKSKVDNNRLSDEEIKQLRELLEIKNKLFDVVSNTNYTQNIDNTNVIQTNRTKQKMFRVDVEVLERWNKFCEDHKHIKVQSLISSALLEYINNHK